MTDISKRIANLSPAKLGLLARRLMGEGEGEFRAQLITRRPDGLPSAPLSFAQERLWFLHGLEPESAVYNVPRAFRLRGRLDLGVLERALSEIVRRHDALRTTFADGDEGPVQLVSPHVPVNVPVTDLRALPAAEREATALHAAGEEVTRPFDLRRGPVFRARLLRLADEDHLALFTIHHIVSDAWSAGLMVGELVALYRAFAAGRPSPLAELPIQYADFAHWQRGWLRGAVLDELLEHWRRRLGDAPKSLGLPIDRPRPEAQDFRGVRRVQTLGREQTAALRALSRGEKSTLFTTLLAAFGVLLNFLTGSEDFVVGSPIANRSRAETKGLIGFFVNALALRADLSGDPTFRELLARVRETMRQAFAHQDLPFDRLVKVLRPERTLSHMPLFQVVFQMNNTPKPDFALPGLTMEPVETGVLSVPFDLVMHASESGDELVLVLECQRALFNDSTMRRHLAVYEAALGEVTSRPEARLSELRGALAEANGRWRAEHERQLEESALEKFKTARRRAVVHKPA
jgi:hypothetical protein